MMKILAKCYHMETYRRSNNSRDSLIRRCLEGFCNSEVESKIYRLIEVERQMKKKIESTKYTEKIYA